MTSLKRIPINPPTRADEKRRDLLRTIGMAISYFFLFTFYLMSTIIEQKHIVSFKITTRPDDKQAEMKAAAEKKDVGWER